MEKIEWDLLLVRHVFDIMWFLPFSWLAIPLFIDVTTCHREFSGTNQLFASYLVWFRGISWVSLGMPRQPKTAKRRRNLPKIKTPFWPAMSIIQLWLTETPGSCPIRPCQARTLHVTDNTLIWRKIILIRLVSHNFHFSWEHRILSQSTLSKTRNNSNLIINHLENSIISMKGIPQPGDPNSSFKKDQG